MPVYLEDLLCCVYTSVWRSAPHCDPDCGSFCHVPPPQPVATPGFRSFAPVQVLIAVITGPQAQTS